MGTDGIARAQPGEGDEHDGCQDDSEPTELTKAVALGVCRGAPVAPRVTVLLYLHLLKGGRERQRAIPGTSAPNPHHG
jgi:hypothetical protein